MRRFLLLLLFLSLMEGPTPVAHAGDYSNQIQASWIKGFKDMTAQWIGAMVHMTGAIGGMVDGVVTNTYQITMQRLQAEALQNYTPGENLCRIGTLTRSLALSDENARTSAMALETMMMGRETNNRARARLYGNHDTASRLVSLGSLYCNPGDNDKTPAECKCDLVAGKCDAASGPLSQRSNRDLDFSRLIDGPMTLKINFTNSDLTPDEQDTLAWLSNVSAYQTLPTLSSIEGLSASSPVTVKTFMDVRSITAARGISRYALSRQIAQKAVGAPGASSFLLNVVKEMGMSDEEAKRYLESEGISLTRDGGDRVEDVPPSYYAQMEVLTKKIYQNPNFYVNLMDKPANVDRIRAALTAIGLMQRRDMKEMLDRRELLLAQLLEFDIRTEEEGMRKRVRQAVAIGE